MIAALMAINALAIDSMLPALPAIGTSLNVLDENQRQWIVTSYLLGFGAAQIFYGTLADRFGRKRVLLIGIGIYAVFSTVASFSDTFAMMMVARVLQGVGAAATRVLTISIVRDCYSGRQMARVMSLSFIVFLAVPIIAPSIGQLIMLVGPWRWIFAGLTIFSLIVITWTAFRLPETLHAEDRTSISMQHIFGAFRLSLTNRMAVGYMLAMTILLGALFGFINSAQQVFEDIFDMPRSFPRIFAVIALFMALSSFLNSRIVGRLGTRIVSHAALLGFIITGCLHAIVAIGGYENIWTFTILQSSQMFCFGLVAPNFGSMAMEPLGRVAGTASSVQGFVTTVGAALVGFYIGQNFNGTVVPLTLGFAVCGIIALLLVLAAEKGRLFQPTETGLATSS